MIYSLICKKNDILPPSQFFLTANILLIRFLHKTNRDRLKRKYIKIVSYIDGTPNITNNTNTSKPQGKHQSDPKSCH
jgi:hypothetical protein